MNKELDTLGLLAATMGLSSKIYHVGIVVPDLEQAVATMGEALGVTFTPPYDLPFTEVQSLAGTHPVKLRNAYATRPIHLELIASIPGTMWDYDSPQRGHHVGVWSDDIRAESAKLERMGMPRTWWATDEQGELAYFCFHQTPYGFMIELVDTMARTVYPDWFRSFDPGLLPSGA